MEDILVVDDDRIILEVMKHILERAGMAACLVSSAEEALDEIKARTFSLMITDLNMPGMDGLELSRKGAKMAPRMPIIMSTGAISPEIIRLAREIGIAKVMSKPFVPSEMLETIGEVIGKGAWTARTASRQTFDRPAAGSSRFQPVVAAAMPLPQSQRDRHVSGN
jgi:DNA-binding NtrC family response regulator